MVFTHNFRLVEIPDNDQLEALRAAGLIFSFYREVFTIEVSSAWYVGVHQQYRALVNSQGQLVLVLVSPEEECGMWSIFSIPRNFPWEFVASSTHCHSRTTALFRAQGPGGCIIGNPSASHDSYSEAVAEALGDVFAQLPMDSWAAVK